MKLTEVKEALENMTNVRFQLPNGTLVPEHFHVTEVGEVARHFIDCGGKVRLEKKVNFQLWVAEDNDHRLDASKLKAIISLAEKTLGLGNWDVEVEYQSETIGKYGLAFTGTHFRLTPTLTACLAEDACGIPASKQPIKLAILGAQTTSNSCEPGSGCCN